MKQNTKIILAILLAGGGILLGRYLIRQYKLLKNVCVSNTNFNWVTKLIQVAEDAVDGGGFDVNTLDTPFQLELTNSADIPVTIKDINLIVYLEGQRIGTITDISETTLDKNSSVTLFLLLDIDEQLAPGAISTTASTTILEGIGALIFGGDMPTTRIEVSGTIKISASIYESFTIRYRLIRTPGGFIEESSGNCEKVKSE